MPDVNLYAPSEDDPRIFGTLGCIAKRDGATPKVVAVTCHHVVLGMFPQPLQQPPLQIDVTIDSATTNTLTINGINTVGAVVIVGLTVMPAGPGPAQYLDVFYRTMSGDTLAGIATAIANQITSLGSDVSASASGTKIAVQWASGFLGWTTKVAVLGPRGADPESELQASLAGTVITLSGQVSAEYYGVYTNLNTGIDQPTFGVFTPLTKGQSLDSVASAIADSINNAVPATVGVIANASGAQVTVIGGVRYLECNISSDTRIGQPGRCYCSKCSWCCGQQLGRVIDARLNLDVALVQLKAGSTYRAQITDIGVVNGTYAITSSDTLSGFAVSKNGVTTGLTSGVVNAIEINGFTEGPRFYTSAMSILGPLDPSDPTHKNRLPFADHGDSGAAVVRTLTNSSGNPACDVVGILFAADNEPPPPPMAFMTPIGAVIDELHLVMETATVPDEVRTVSETEGISAMADQPAVLGESAVFAAGPEPLTRFETRMLEVEREITATPLGQAYATLVRRHFPEVQILFNTNRRVATVWHRSGGPQIVQVLAKVAQSQDQPIPKGINGRSLADSLARIHRVLNRYASKALAKDLNQVAPQIKALIGLTYSQVLNALHASGMEQ